MGMCFGVSGFSFLIYSHIFRHVSYIEVKGVRQMAKREEILKLFPRELRSVLGQVPVDFKEVQEIRLRTGMPLMIICGNQEFLVARDGSLRQDTGNLDRDMFLAATQAQMKETVEYMGSFSLYAAEEELRQGFLTIQGGHRIGVAGRTLVQGQDIRLMKFISFINIRVAHQVPGCADGVMDFLYDGRFLNTLVISPPRCGKTTLLRDIIRQVSDGWVRHSGDRVPGVSVGVVDERSELAACYQGVPQNDLGMRTDVLDCCPKSQGMMMLVRTMAPGVIAVDEIGSRQDAEAIEYVRNCGCALAATIHGSSLEDIRQKPSMGGLLAQGTFERLILLDSREGPGHVQCIWDGRSRILYEDGTVPKRV